MWIVLIIRFLGCPKEESSEMGDWDISGDRVLVNGIRKENLGGKTHLIRDCLSGAKRLKVLRDSLSIKSIDEEASSLEGQMTVLGQLPRESDV